jgi:uncharacterized protein
MKRDFKQILMKWKDNPSRVPLIVRGARQVGKTFIIQAFGDEEFESSLTVNFEASPAYKACFETLDPISILSQIEVISGRRIIPGKTLLFLDEIQQCSKALISLRYFKEKMPDLHVIAAGSLLEFALYDENFSFPVGRVQFARLYPLSFEEYLDAKDDHALREQLYSYDFHSLPPMAIHEHLMTRVMEYFTIGGMPAAVMAFLKTKTLLEVKYVQQAILDSFEADFGKYAQKSQHRHLKKIFLQIPRLIGSHVKYSRIDPELLNPARDMKKALELLQMAGLISLIFATSAGNIPLFSGLKEHIFKLLFLDIGLVEQAMNITPPYSGLLTGPLAEQFVGQEWLAKADPLLDRKLFFWTRENSAAEVDYLFEYKGIIYPVEVKSGTTGKLKSLQIFMEEKKAPLGIKISQDSLQFSKKILSVPFYLATHLPRLIDSLELPKLETAFSE